MPREFSDSALLYEIHRRREARANGLCDYCGLPRGSDPPCKYHRRHASTEPQAITVPPGPYARLVQFLAQHDDALQEVIEGLNLPLPRCEGQGHACGRPVLYLTPNMTAYPWDGTGEDPNQAPLLCPECSDEYVAFWQEQWDEYHRGCM